MRYSLEVAEWLRGKQGNEIYATYGGVVADVGQTVVAERKAERAGDFTSLLTEAVSRRYQIRVDPAVVRASFAEPRPMCADVGGDFDPAERRCCVELPGAG